MMFVELNYTTKLSFTIEFNSYLDQIDMRLYQLSSTFSLIKWKDENGILRDLCSDLFNYVNYVCKHVQMLSKSRFALVLHQLIVMMQVYPFNVQFRPIYERQLNRVSISIFVPPFYYLNTYFYIYLKQSSPKIFYVVMVILVVFFKQHQVGDVTVRNVSYLYDTDCVPFISVSSQTLSFPAKQIFGGS